MVFGKVRAGWLAGHAARKAQVARGAGERGREGRRERGREGGEAVRRERQGKEKGQQNISGQVRGGWFILPPS